MLSPSIQTGSRVVPTHARIGIILSSSNRVVEGQLRAFAPPELAVHVTRMRMAKSRTQAISEQIDIILRAAELLADAKVDLIVLQASALAMEKGPDAESATVRAISEATGTPALTSTQAMVEALRALALKRVVLVSPSAKEMNDAEAAYLRAQGFDVVNSVGLDLQIGAGLTMTAGDWVNLVRANDRPEADGYFLSGSNTTMIEAIGAIEERLSKPAVSSTQATLWASVGRLKAKLGKLAFAPELGKLFTRL
jgi:maleate cis-trans isomerase